MLIAMKRNTLSWLARVISLDPTGGPATAVQEKIEQAIIGTGVRTKYAKTLSFGSCMTVTLGEDAYKAIRPVQRQVLEEIQKHLPERAKREGWHLPDPTLRIAVVRGPHLSPDDVTAEAADEDVTPDFNSSPRSGTTRARSASRIRLFEIGAAGRGWEIDPHSPVVVGRRPKNDSTPAGVDIVLENDYVSARHLVIEATTMEDGTPAVSVTDQGSKHGTKVNGRPIRPYTPVTVAYGQVIELAGRPGVRLRVIIQDAGWRDSDATLRMTDDDDVTPDWPEDVTP